MGYSMGTLSWSIRIFEVRTMYVVLLYVLESFSIYTVLAILNYQYKVTLEIFRSFRLKRLQMKMYILMKMGTLSMMYILMKLVALSMTSTFRILRYIGPVAGM